MNKNRPTKFVPVKDSSIFLEHFSVVMFEEACGSKKQ